jgi:tetratricopeptide (TPR) repeat protein
MFGYASYRFIAPKFSTAEEKLAGAQAYLAHDRPEAAIDQVNALLDGGKLKGEAAGRAHLMVAEALEAAQKQKHLSVDANHANIITQTRQAVALGVKPTGDMYRRLAESYEALDKPAEALLNYRLAMRSDADLDVRFQKKIIELQLASGDAGAGQTIETYLAHAHLSPTERAWAVEQKARLLINGGDLARARAVLDEGLKLTSDSVRQGALNYWVGYIAWALGKQDEAERYLRVARDQLGVADPLDADAAELLGRILLDRGQNAQATSCFQVVLTSHPDSAAAPAALLGRGLARIAVGEDDAGLVDLHDLTMRTSEKTSRAKNKERVVEGLRHASAVLSGKGNFAGAIEVLAYEQRLVGDPPAEFYARLGVVFEKRADQVEASLTEVVDGERTKRLVQVRQLRASAGDAYVSYSNALTLADDKGYADALWKGVDLYDRSGDIQRTISALELFVNQKPDDPLTPDALLRLGRAYQASGQFDKAIEAFQRNQFRYPQSLAASKSGVPLAQAYIAKGSDYYAKAETVLKGVVENNPLLTPVAEEFKQALFELGQLYYRTGRYEEAVARLEEWTERYPKDARLGELLFLMADSYRKSAMLLDAQLAGARVGAAAAGAARPEAAGDRAADAVEASSERKQRLGKAKQLYDKVVDAYRQAPPRSDIGKLQLKLSHFYRADCLYDLGDYGAAVKLYDAAAFRYQDDPSALAAYVQIVNAYCAMGKVEEAKTANERAKWLLRRMPPEAFTDGSFAMPKQYWDQWLNWAGESGMWK